MHAIAEWDRKATAPLARRFPWLGLDNLYARRDDPLARLWKPWQLVLVAFSIGMLFPLYLALPGYPSLALVAPLFFNGYALAGQFRLRRQLRDAGIEIPTDKRF